MKKQPLWLDLIYKKKLQETTFFFKCPFNGFLVPCFYWLQASNQEATNHSQVQYKIFLYVKGYSFVVRNKTQNPVGGPCAAIFFNGLVQN